MAMRDYDRFTKPISLDRGGTILCLGPCGKEFVSEDKIKFRFCTECKGKKIWKDSSSSDASLPNGECPQKRIPTDAQTGKKRRMKSHSRRRRNVRDPSVYIPQHEGPNGYE